MRTDVSFTEGRLACLFAARWDSRWYEQQRTYSVDGIYELSSSVAKRAMEEREKHRKRQVEFYVIPFVEAVADLLNEDPSVGMEWVYERVLRDPRLIGGSGVEVQLDHLLKKLPTDRLGHWATCFEDGTLWDEYSDTLVRILRLLSHRAELLSDEDEDEDDEDSEDDPSSYIESRDPVLPQQLGSGIAEPGEEKVEEKGFIDDEGRDYQLIKQLESTTDTVISELWSETGPSVEGNRFYNSWDTFSSFLRKEYNFDE